jgi:hypothetical protein
MWIRLMVNCSWGVWKKHLYSAIYVWYMAVDLTYL